MKYLATYALFVIAISALALSGNKLFYALAAVYEYGIYAVMGAIAIGIIGYNFMPERKEQ
jgi:hypothetical protein